MKQPTILILGASGKTGRRVSQRLHDKGITFRAVSRSSTPAFDWNTPATWEPVLEGIGTVYINYAPDIAIPGAVETVEAFVERAKAHGVKRLVLLSGRGEEEAQRCEQVVQHSGLEWTVVRASWFNQNFSEGAFYDMVMSGAIALPAGDIPEPFTDVDDIADVVTAALCDDGHLGEIYEVTGPELLTFAQTAEILGEACNRKIQFTPLPHETFIGALRESHAPDDIVWLLDYLFTTVLDGRNASLGDGVQRALGRTPKAFATYAKETAALGVWCVANAS